MLENLTDYPCLAQTVGIESNTDDENMLEDVLNTFKLFGITEEQKDNIFRLLSLILAFSGLEFEQTEEDGKLIFGENELNYLTSNSRLEL